MTNVISLSFFRFDSAVSKLWAFAMMGAARAPLSRIRDIGFWKLFGSGSGEGFTPVPNTAVYAILATWPDEASARHHTTQADVFAKYAERADESWTVYLHAASARGAWSGVQPFTPTDEDIPDQIAVITRATVRPGAALRFWQQVPDISAVIGTDPNVLFKIGLGEVPWLQQVTFSIWPDSKHMAHFAHKDGPHLRAVKHVRAGNWFKEELYARFAVLGDHGTWGGVSPLKTLEVSL